MFGKKKDEGSTVLLLDIESGSVGAALAHHSQGRLPKLFGETRVPLPLLSTHNSEALTHYIEKATREALEHVSTVAARLRNNKHVSSAGTIESAAVFLGAPWGVPNLEIGKPHFIPGMKEFLNDEIGAFAGEVPLAYYTGADAAVVGAQTVLPQENILLCIVRGEIVELILIGEHRVEGYATVPFGSRSIFRTLKTHADISDAEVHSLLSLASRTDSPLYEPLGAAGDYFIEHLLGAAQELLSQGGTGGIYVIGASPAAEWFAQTLGEADALNVLFPHGGVVRAVASHHFLPHIDVRKGAPDLYLTLDALFVDSKFGVV